MDDTALVCDAMRTIDIATKENGILWIFSSNETLEEYHCPTMISKEYLERFPRDYRSFVDWIGMRIMAPEVAILLRTEAFLSKSEEEYNTKCMLMEWYFGLESEQVVKLQDKVSRYINGEKKIETYWIEKKRLLQQQIVVKQRDCADLYMWFEMADIGSKEETDLDQNLYHLNEEQLACLLRNMYFDDVIKSFWIMPKRLIRKILESSTLEMQHRFLCYLYISMQKRGIAWEEEAYHSKQMFAQLYDKYMIRKTESCV